MIKLRQNLESPLNIHQHLFLSSMCTNVDMNQQQKQDRKETAGIRKNIRNRFIGENY